MFTIAPFRVSGKVFFGVFAVSQSVVRSLHGEHVVNKEYGMALRANAAASL
jgi:hypothetical protein